MTSNEQPFLWPLRVYYEDTNPGVTLACITTDTWQPHAIPVPLKTALEALA